MIVSVGHSARDASPSCRPPSTEAAKGWLLLSSFCHGSGGCWQCADGTTTTASRGLRARANTSIVGPVAMRTGGRAWPPRGSSAISRACPGNRPRHVEPSWRQRCELVTAHKRRYIALLPITSNTASCALCFYIFGDDAVADRYQRARPRRGTRCDLSRAGGCFWFAAVAPHTASQIGRTRRGSARRIAGPGWAQDGAL